eukprot:11061316-Ditylum_brightwellii.AAC.1
MDNIQFGMKSTQIQCCRKYYIYKGAAGGEDVVDEDIDIAIGTYNIAFLANIFASYVFKMTEKNFRKSKYRGIYRDNGLVILVDQKKDIHVWLREYQQLVNELVGSGYL